MKMDGYYFHKNVTFVVLYIMIFISAVWDSDKSGMRLN